jgi:hypothetical protein
MNLLTTLEIFAGGVGSGCHGPNCGRKAGLSERAQRALASYKPVSKEKVAKTKANEVALARIVDGKSTNDSHPFDILKGNIAIEVKTLIEGGHDKITMHPKSMAKKDEYITEHKLKSTYTVAVDMRGGKNTWYFKKGLGSFRLSAMERLSSPEELKRLLK